MWPAQNDNQKKWPDDRPQYTEPHRAVCNIRLMKKQRGKRDHGTHPAQPADEKVNRDFPRPHRWPDDWLTIITRLLWNGAPRNSQPAPGDCAFRPGFFAQLV